MLSNSILMLEASSFRSIKPMVLVTCRHHKVRKKPMDLQTVTRPKNVLRRPQQYDYFLVLDFEATCEKSNQTMNYYQQEIVEFPVHKVNSNNFQTEDVFHSFVKPIINPQLSNYCSSLTGISQVDVDSSPELGAVLEYFDRWMTNNVITSGKSFIFVTSGDWDLKKMLPTECREKKIPMKSYFTDYININKSFAYTMGKWPRFGKGRIPAMLALLELAKIGEFHRGVSDCQNIISIMKSLADKGCIFKPEENT